MSGHKCPTRGNPASAEQKHRAAIEAAAHAALDKAVDAAYGYKGAIDDSSRVAFLFERYEGLK